MYEYELHLNCLIIIILYPVMTCHSLHYLIMTRTVGDQFTVVNVIITISSTHYDVLDYLIVKCVCDVSVCVYASHSMVDIKWTLMS